MPIYLLDNRLRFPPVEGAEDGIVAVGGDLSTERLLLAYRCGIFPWFSVGDPIFWHAPDQRFVLMLDNLHISKSMRRVLNAGKFRATMDNNFVFVIEQCANVARKDENGTWITKEMIAAYTSLHKLGYAHSLEVWQDEQIVGGVYGVSIGKCFFAESMFHTESNASKFAIIKLVEFLKQHDFHFLDAQVFTAHVSTLGAANIPRATFMKMLKKGLQEESMIGKWRFQS